MDVVLDHRSQPFPDPNRGAAWRHACAVEIRGCQCGENLHRLAVKSCKVVERRVVAIREFTAVAGIPARTPAGVLGIHEAFDWAQGPRGRTEGEPASVRAPRAGLQRTATDADGRTR